MSTISNMTEKQPPSYPLRMPQELRERLAEVAKANGRSMNAEILARLQSSFDLAPPDRIAVDTSQGMKVYAPEGELPSAEDIADKVAKRLDRMIPMSKEALQTYLDIFERRSNERHRKWWKEQFGYDPETPPVPKQGGAPVKSVNTKRTRKKA